MKKEHRNNIPRDNSHFLEKWFGPSFRVFLLIVILTSIIIRVRLLDVPLERDEGEYAYAGQLILQGVAPYSNIYNMKLPGVYAAYALILAAFGHTQSGIHLGLLVINVLTIVLVFLLAKYLVDSFTGFFAAAAFAVLSLSQTVQGLFAHSEHFVILFALAGILLLIYAIDRNSNIFLSVAALSLGIGFVMKQHGIAFVVFSGLYLVISQLGRKPFKFKSLFMKTTVFVIFAALPFGLTCLILWRAGVFEKFWFWTGTYGLKYVLIVPIQLGLEKLKSRMTLIVNTSISIWILAFVGLVTLFMKTKVRRYGLFIAGFFLFSFLSTCPGFYFRPHYFVLLLPVVALLSAVGLFGISQFLEHRVTTIKKKLIIVLLTIATPLYTLYHQQNYLFERNPIAVSRMTYGYNPFPESLKIAEYIKANSSDNDTIAVLGSEPQILFYANRHSATSYIYMYPLMEPQPYALQMQEEMIQQIEAAKPRFLVFISISVSWLLRPSSDKLIFDWFEQYQQHYNRVGVIDLISEDNIIYLWDQDAENYTPRSPHGVIVLERSN